MRVSTHQLCMSQKNPQKNIVLFVAFSPPLIESSLREYKDSPESTGQTLALLYQNKATTKEQKGVLDQFDLTIRCNLNSSRAITRALKPYEDQFLAVTCRSEVNIPAFQKVIPHLPYLRTPTTESLDWATHKLKMRRRFASYDRSITPNFMVVDNAQKKTIKDIEGKIGFPLVIKPVGLSTSLLVNIAYHHEELEQSLKRIFRTIRRVHKEMNGRGEPQVLVEQFIDGDMYTVDVHVGSRGAVYFNPFVHVKTGKTVGFDDFFAYQTTTPTNLNKTSIEDARETSIKAVKALGLRSTTAHIELLKTEEGWKVIEVGPRLGGFRPEMYKLSYGINATANDIFTRIPEKLSIPKRVKGHTAVIKIYPEKEGVITNIVGAKKAQELTSFYGIKVNKQIGDRALFAKHGGKEIFRVTLFNEDRSKLLADIRRLEKTVKVNTE